jgi:Rad3-related DNA helicase
MRDVAGELSEVASALASLSVARAGPLRLMSGTMETPASFREIVELAR